MCTYVQVTSPTEALPRSEQRRQAILAATLQVIGEGGIDAVTHRRVAAAAGVPLGSTSYYFASREALIREAFRGYIASADVQIGALHEGGSESSIEGLARTMVRIVELEQREPCLLQAEYELILAASRDPELAADYRAWERANAAGLAEPLERLGAARPIETARGVLRLIRGHELEALSGEPDPEELGRQITCLIRDAVGAAH